MVGVFFSFLREISVSITAIFMSLVWGLLIIPERVQKEDICSHPGQAFWT